MDVNLVDNLDDAPKKKVHTVPRGTYKRLLEELMKSKESCMTVSCSSVADATKKQIGLYNFATNHSIPVNVWRRESVVYIEKVDE